MTDISLTSYRAGIRGGIPVDYIFLCIEVLECVSYTVLSYSSGLAPLKMYRELQRDMGPYRTVHIALYAFTHVLQVNYMCFLYVQRRHMQILHCYICQVLL